ncbi:hypothetical protein Tco_1537537, partial [Tanacetum coccineum]
ADTIIQERDAFQAEVPVLISKEFVDHEPKIIEELFKIHMNNNVIQVHPTTSASTSTTSVDLQQQLYLKMKSNLHDQATDPSLWDVLKRNLKSLLPQILLAGMILFVHNIMMTIRKMMLLLRERKERKDKRHQKV